ncbi:uncharacterized protein [Typha angustifolia]|uniref:uncharacterized protein n=1 Tax=Typha angustifolia TaxID=59011 RepID=UPI003C2CB8B4
MQALSRFSSPNSKRVFVGISKTIFRSDPWRRGKSYAASVPADSFKPQNGQKRISKQARRALVEVFVEKYRASHEGKFPTASVVQQEVGGSFYTVREMVQELEYNCKMSPSNKSETIQLDKTKKVNYLSSDAKKESSFSSRKKAPTMEVVGKIEIDEDPSLKLAKVERQNHGESMRVQKSNASTFSTDHSEQAEPSLSLKLETAQDTSTSPSGETEIRTDMSATEILQDKNAQEEVGQMESDKVSKLDEQYSEQPSKYEHEESSPPTANFWGNLKSFADGIINLWKKM